MEVEEGKVLFEGVVVERKLKEDGRAFIFLESSDHAQRDRPRDI